MAAPTVAGSLLVAESEWQSLDWYGTPLFYDILFDEETEQEARWLDELFALFGPLPPLSPSLEPAQPPIVLEPACGSGRLLRALRRRGYHCIGFDRQAAAVDFARARQEAEASSEEQRRAASLSAVVPSSSSSSSVRPYQSSSPAPACLVFQADLSSFSSTHPQLVPAGSVHLCHCLVSSLKYVASDEQLMEHFAAVAGSLVQGGLYVVALHLSDYSDASSSVDEHEAERDGVAVAATITVGPPDRLSRSEQVSIRMAVTRSSDSSGSSGSSSQQQLAASHYRWEETMRTYDRWELWQLLVGGVARWFDVVATFDYEQARHGAVEAPLHWPDELRSFDAALCAAEPVQPHSAPSWIGWEGVEALAVVLKRR